MNWVDTTDLRNWANRRDCQETLPQLVRKLIRATSESIKSIKFPSGENVLIGGWDGILVVTEETEYLPLGISLWEFGANSDVKGKADDDYTKRTGNPLGYDSSECTFVFVTPRLWTKGDEWAEEKKKEGKWKDVKVINAEVLEEWLENAPTVASWLAVKHLGKYPSEGIQPTEDFWAEWASGPKITLKPQVLLGGRSEQIENVTTSLATPALIAVQGTSRDEALAFIASAFKSSPDKEEDFYSRSIIVDTPEAFRQLAALKKPLILIARFEDVGVFNRAINNGHSVIVPLGADTADSWSDKVILPKIDRDSFVEALADSGITRELAEKYSKESLRNVTILRRTLEFVRSKPDWSKPENVSDLIPALLIGRWNEDYEKDREIIARLALVSYEEYAKKLSLWLYTSDSPIVKIGSTWRLASPLDAWTNASKHLTRNDFLLLQECFLEILGEIDPAFELDPEQRYMASVYGKVRQYSGWMREGITQSLILVSLFGSQLKFDLPVSGEAWVNQVVARLLNTNNPLLWKSFEHNLPLIAEASPSEFLNQLERNLDVSNPSVSALFDEDPGFLTTRSYHTGLLWALEGIAWLPEYLSRSALILAELSAADPGGSISNRPINSLSAIFKPWFYQTLASFKERIEVLRLIADREPDIAWTLLTRLLPEGGNESGFPNHKLRWRGFDEILQKSVTYVEIWETHSAIVDILLSIFDYSEQKLVNLIERSVHMSWADQDKVLSFVESNLDKINQTEYTVWHSIRRILSHHRSYSDTEWALHSNLLTRYEKIYHNLEPVDEIQKVQWLFEEHWPSFPEGIEREETLHENQQNFIDQKRLEGLKKVYNIYSIEKIKEMASIIKEPEILGDTTGRIVDDESDILSISKLLNSDNNSLRFFRGFIFRKSIINGIDWAFQLYKQLQSKVFPDNILSHILLPLHQSEILWNFIEGASQDTKFSYWSRVNPHFYHISKAEKVRGLRYLISYKRFISGIHACRLFIKEIPTKILVELLEKAATEKAEEDVQLQSYDIQKFFDTLDKRKDVKHHTLIKLEWLYISILESYGGRRNTKLLHDELAKSLEFFVEVLKWIYKPDDEHDGTQTDDLTNDQLGNRARQAFQLLQSLHKIPGVDEAGNIDKVFLDNWVGVVRDLAGRYGRVEVADSYIGKLLAQFKEDGNNWPPDEICDVIEKVNSENLKRGFSSAVFNKRGSSSRSPFEGGNRERQIAEYFEKLAEHHRNKFPLVATILSSLANGYIGDAKRIDDEAERNRLDY